MHKYGAGYVLLSHKRSSAHIGELATDHMLLCSQCDPEVWGQVAVRTCVLEKNSSNVLFLDLFHRLD